MTNTFTTKQMDIIEDAITGSELWQRMNRNIKALYDKRGRVPSDEEYQALRNMLICKTMEADENVLDTISKLMANKAFAEVAR